MASTQKCMIKAQQPQTANIYNVCYAIQKDKVSTYDTTFAKAIIEFGSKRRRQRDNKSLNCIQKKMLDSKKLNETQLSNLIFLYCN
jgi:hypothetical protein